MDPWTLEKTVDAGGLPGVLRALAAALEGGLDGAGEQRVGGDFAGLPPLLRQGRVQRLELVAEARESGGYALRLTADGADQASPQGKRPVSAGKALAENASGARTLGGRPNARPSEAQAKAREKYRQLKKALQADFSAMCRAVEAGALPQRDTLESFLALAEGMAALPQPVKDAHGPEAGELARANAVFLEDALALRRAFDARDVSACAQVLERLTRRRTACHAQYR